MTRQSNGRLALFTLTAVLASACSGLGTPIGVVGSDGTTGSGTTELPPSSSAAGASAAAIAPRPTPFGVPASCPLTMPTTAFVPPMPWPPVPPSAYAADWYGTNALWVKLASTGEVWPGLPHDSAGFGQKTFWFSANYRDVAREPAPAITVTGQRLDGTGEMFSTAGQQTMNAGSNLGLSMLVGIEVPTAGCWELEGSYKGATLDYVVWIPGT
jgi:hypothetical protein